MDVRQGEFAFGKRDEGDGTLVTGDVNSCMGLVAVHRQSRLVFLAHIDVPWFDGSVRGALEELKSRVPDCQEVEVYDVAGIPPGAVLAAVLAVALLGIYFGDGTSLPIWIGALVLTVLYGGTRARTRFLLWRLGFRKPKLLTGRQATGKPISCWNPRVNVHVSAGPTTSWSPVLTFPKQKARDERFTVDDQTWSTTLRRGVRATLHRARLTGHMTRAKGSA